MTPSEMKTELEALRNEMVLVNARLKARTETRRSPRASYWLAAGVVVLAIGTWTERAFSAACATGLICVSAGQPAKADDINNNFDTLKRWIEAKVGAMPAGSPGAASSSAVTTASETVNGPTLLKGTMKYDCNACGSASTLEGTADWGDLTVQGRVMSANSNLHLSPPGGFSVVINDGYRAAGGTQTAAGASLSVQGQVDAKRFVPQYVSPWTSVSSSSNYTWPHGLGEFPTFVQIQTCKGADFNGTTCTGRVVMSGPSGFNDGSSCINPINVSADASNIYFSTNACAVWGYWTTSGWTTSSTAYYRIVAFR